MSDDQLEENKNSLIASAVEKAAPLGVGLIVGVLAVLGIQGDSLARLLRNDESRYVTLALLVATVGIALPYAIPVKMRETPTRIVEGRETSGWKFGWQWFVFLTVNGVVWIGRVAGAAILIATGLAIWHGISGLAEREEPTVAVEVTRTDDEVLLDILATAPTLRSNEKMLLKVSAYPSQFDYEKAEKEAIEGKGADTDFVASAESLCRNATTFDHPTDSRTLAWVESGPNREGRAESSIEVIVPQGTDHVCALALLKDRDDKSLNDNRSVVVLLESDAIGSS